MGARADKTMIKSGQDFASVEAVFTLDVLTPEIKSFFESIAVEPENTIIIYRYLSLNGKSDVRVNGQTVTNAMLKRLTTQLVDLHGQHGHQALLDEKNHLQILDSFQLTDTKQAKENLQALLQQLKQVDADIAQIGGMGEERVRNIELLTYQIEEIEQANLQENEEEQLKLRKTFLLNAEKIYESLNNAQDSLNENEFSALTMLKISTNHLKNIVSYDEKLEKLHDKLNELYYELLDESEKVNEILQESSYSEEELNQLEQRLDLVSSLKRKYGSTIENVLQYLASTKTKLDTLLHAEEKLEELKEKRKTVLQKVYETCKQLTALRQDIASMIEKQIVEQLKDLGMLHSSFKVVFTNHYGLENLEQHLTQVGADQVEFMFSANLGEPVKPLSKIISGGEMSRFMLAIQCVMNENNNKTFVFDEIDNGIGVITGLVVAQKLAQIATHNQVVCVTHLAQIASFADIHLGVSKHITEDRTHSSVQALNKEEVVAEVARLLGAESQSDVGRLHAKELLDNAKQYKKNFK